MTADGSAESRERAVLEAVPKQLFIGGKWVDGVGEGDPPGRGPATGETIAEVADADARRRAARRSQPPTSSRPSGASTRRASAARSCAAPTS